MRNWSDVLPPAVAKAQHYWERRRSAVRMRAMGMKFYEIGERLGVGARRTWQMVGIARGEDKLSPIEIYLDPERHRAENARVRRWLKS